MTDREMLLSGMAQDVGYPAPLGPYMLLASLGRGGMGAVHLAKHGNVAGIEKYCVIKTLKRTYTMDDEYIMRFVDEARLVVHLSHRNICPVFDVGRVKDRYYIAMEYVAGQDLHTLMDRARGMGGRFPEELALHIACEVLEGLGYAHRLAHPVTGEPLNLVHRDVSPHNVLISYEGEVKLIDFGVAASAVKEGKSDPNIVMGKLAYMSSENLRGEHVDGRHDLLSTAVMLYELLTGFSFYEGMERMGVINAIAGGGYTPPRMGSIDPALQPILLAALNQNVQQRTPTCEDFKDQLSRYMLHKQMAASTRHLRGIVQRLCPGEQEAMRAKLAGYRDLKPPSPPSESNAGIPRAKPKPAPARNVPGGVDFSEVDGLGEQGAVHIAVNPSSEHSEVLDFSLVPETDAIYRPEEQAGMQRAPRAPAPVGQHQSLPSRPTLAAPGAPAPAPAPPNPPTGPTAPVATQPHGNLLQGGAPIEETMVIQRAPGRASAVAQKKEQTKRWYALAAAIAMAWILLALLVWFVLSDPAKEEPAATEPATPVVPVVAPKPPPPPPPPKPEPKGPPSTKASLGERVRWLEDSCEEPCVAAISRRFKDPKNQRGKRARRLGRDANRCIFKCTE
jgi:serine/threonine-protein kinase